jgi:hypothetical protein
MAQDLKADTASQVVRLGPAVSISDGFTAVTSLTLAGADEFVAIKNDGTVVDISGRTTDLAAVAGADGMYDFTITDTDLSLEGNFEIVATDVNLILPIVNRFNVMSEAAYDSKYGTDSGTAMKVNAAATTLSVSDLLSSGQALDTTLGVLDVVNLANTTTVATDAETAIGLLNDIAASDVWDEDEALAIYNRLILAELTKNWSADVRVVAVSAIPAEFDNLVLYGSDDPIADDWNNNFGSMNDTGVWSDGGDQGTSHKWLLIRNTTTGAGDDITDDFWIKIQFSSDSQATWKDICFINMKGTCGLTDSFYFTTGGFKWYPDIHTTPASAYAQTPNFEQNDTARRLLGTLGTDLLTKLSSDDWQANLELQYDGTGLIGDAFPSRQDQVAAISGSLTLPLAAESKVLTDGAATNDYDATANHDGTLYTVTDNDNSDPGINTELRYDAGSAVVSHLHMHGWYQDGTAPFTNSCLTQAYDWEGAAYETIEVLSHVTAEQEHNPLILSRHVSTVANGPGGDAGVIDIRFIQAAQDTGSGSTINLDHCVVMYISPTLTAAEVNAEMVDVLNVDTWAELAADPGAAPTITGMLKLLYMALRNKVVTTASEQTIHQDDGTELLESDLTDIADTSFTKDKMRSPD